MSTKQKLPLIWTEPRGPGTTNVYGRPKGRRRFLGGIIHGGSGKYWVPLPCGVGGGGWRSFETLEAAIWWYRSQTGL